MLNLLIWAGLTAFLTWDYLDSAAPGPYNPVRLATTPLVAAVSVLVIPMAARLARVRLPDRARYLGAAGLAVVVHLVWARLVGR